MRTYGQYCPMARAAEVFAERWTPIIVRNLHLGATTFSEILDGAPGLSRTLLSRRLDQLERLGIVETEPKPAGRGRLYRLTDAGEGLSVVCDALGEWGGRWLDVVPEHLEPGFTLWALCQNLNVGRLPRRRVVVQLDFPDRRPRERFWLLLEHGRGEVCKEYPGTDVDLFIRADSDAFTLWHMGRLSWAEAIGSGRIHTHGPASLIRAFPTWKEPSHDAAGARRK